MVLGLSEEMHVHSALLREKAVAIARCLDALLARKLGARFEKQRRLLQQEIHFVGKQIFGLSLEFIQNGFLCIIFVQGIKLP